MAKILIAVPTYENILPETFRSIYNLDKGGHDVHFDFFRGYDVANARNAIAQATLESGYDYVMMVDADNVLPPDALVNLLEANEDGVHVGYCLSRPKTKANDSGKTTAFRFGGRDYVPENAYTADEIRDLRENKGGIKVQIRGSGLICAMIHRSVFDRLTYPYFEWVVYSNKTQLSEDLYFCEQVNERSIPIWLDTRVGCGHLMRYVKYIDEKE